MDKLTMATKVLLKLIETDKTGFDAEGIAAYSFEIADAMQAEAEKREDKTRPEVLLTKDKDGNCLHFHHEFGHKKCMDCGASLEEWQPDWSQAPEWANWWAIRQNSSDALWCVNKPTVTDDCLLSHGGCGVAPSFGFTGSHIVERPDGF